jgi:DNA-binding CsgD family transcriptional regulator
MLENFGLDAHADAVYRLMLVRQDRKIEEIARQLGISVKKVAASLDRLTELRLLRRSLDADGGYLMPVTPTVVFQALLHQQQAELLRKQQEFVETQEAVTRLTAEYAALCCTGSRSEFEHIDGWDAVHARLTSLADWCATDCLSLVPGGGQSPESLEARRVLDQTMLKRGVKVLTVYMASMTNDKATLDYARWLTSIGGQVRTVPTLPLPLMIFDREAAVVARGASTLDTATVQLGGTAVMSMASALFDVVWTGATPLGEEPLREDGATAREREVLRLLAQGATDQVVAKRLALSLRTVRRIMADISDRLGARSRFEIAAKACERGWLAP